jgi:hypothetical protein
MLFLKGLECPTQYFDWADSRSDEEMRAAPPCAGASSPGNKRVSRLFPGITEAQNAVICSEADQLFLRRREVGLAMIHSAPEALHFDLNRVKLAIV